MNDLDISRGDVWLVYLDPVIGHEQASRRPCLVISFYQKNSKLSTIIPITTRYRKLSWLVKIEPPEGGLIQTSYIMCNQIRTVASERFGRCRLGEVKSSILHEVEERLRFLLGL